MVGICGILVKVEKETVKDIFNDGPEEDSKSPIASCV
jgi:hypothetical protein